MSTENRLFIRGYKRLEYIGFNGSQYLDLASHTTEEDIEITFRRRNGYTQTNFLFGTNPDTPTSQIVGAWYGSQGFVVQNGSERRNVPLDTNWHTVKFTSTKTYLDGVEQGNAGTRSYFQNLVIGSARAPNSSGAVESRCYHGDISLAKVGDSIFVPVQRVSDNAIGMYDTATKMFFGNGGTGTDFVAGPEIQQVEYIESHGSELIKTTHIPTNLTKIHVVAKIKGPNDTLVGSGNSASVRQQVFNYQGIQVRFGAASSYNLGVVKDAVQDILVDFKNNKGYLDGVATTITDTRSGAITYPLWINGNNVAGSLSGGAGSNEYRLIELYENDVLTEQFVPVLVGTEYAMYDIISGAVYRNEGTGSFTGGGIVPQGENQMFVKVIRLGEDASEYREVRFLKVMGRISYTPSGFVDPTVAPITFESQGEGGLYICETTDPIPEGTTLVTWED